MLHPTRNPGDDCTQTQESTILYPESGYSLIQYGPSEQTDILFSPTETTNTQNSRDLTSFIERGRQFLAHPPRGRYRDSLLASRRLLALASSTAMVTRATDENQSTTHTPGREDDEDQEPEDDMEGSETQIPTLFFPPLPPVDDSPTQVPPPSIDDSPTQVPTLVPTQVPGAPRAPRGWVGGSRAAGRGGGWPGYGGWACGNRG